MSFLDHHLKHGDSLTGQVYDVPMEIDREIAALKLRAMGVSIDVLTAEQEHYLNEWSLGTGH